MQRIEQHGPVDADAMGAGPPVGIVEVHHRAAPRIATLQAVDPGAGGADGVVQPQRLQGRQTGGLEEQARA